jgi:hypothetical protein
MSKNRSPIRQVTIWTAEQPPPATRWEDDRLHDRTCYMPHDAQYQKDRQRLIRRLAGLLRDETAAAIVDAFAARKIVTGIIYTWHDGAKKGKRAYPFAVDSIDACIARILFLPEQRTLPVLDAMDARTHRWHMIPVNDLRTVTVGASYDRLLDTWHAEAIRHPEEARAYLALTGENT